MPSSLGSTVLLKGNVTLAHNSYPRASNAHVSYLDKLAHTRVQNLPGLRNKSLQDSFTGVQVQGRVQVSLSIDLVE